VTTHNAKYTTPEPWHFRTFQVSCGRTIKSFKTIKEARDYITSGMPYNEDSGFYRLSQVDTIVIEQDGKKCYDA